MVEIEIDGDPADVLPGVFAELAADGVTSVRLIFAETVTPNHHLAQTLRELVEATPSLRSVVLNHPSPGIRFVASSLALHLPKIQFNASTVAERSRQTTPTPAPAAGSPVIARVDQDLEAGVRNAFASARDRRSRAVVLVLDVDRPVDRRLVALIGEAVVGLLTLEMLVLVHPSSSVGLLASGLALRYPRIRVVPCAREEHARALVRDRTSR